MLQKVTLCLLFFVSVICFAETKGEERFYDVRYKVKLLPSKKQALVDIQITDASLLKSLSFILDPDMHSHIKANGKLNRDGNDAIWTPPKKNASFKLTVKIDNQRTNGGYDALMTKDWAIFRGDDLVPRVNVRSLKGARSRSFLNFELPKGWHSVKAGWERDKSVALKKGQKHSSHFIIDNPERHFDRPIGWMIAGNIGTRNAQLGNTKLSVSAPKDSGLRRMDILSFMNFIWPTIDDIFESTPPHLLILGADDPMWRGGLSASNSFYVHADRPIVGENGTSTLVHELFHMITRIRGDDNDDWIAEGLAEFYSIELIYRSGGMDEERRDLIKKKMARDSKHIKKLRVKNSKGRITDKATLLFYDLDEEIKQHTKGKKSLDDLVRSLIDIRKISVESLVKTCKKVAKKKCATLNSVAKQ